MGLVYTSLRSVVALLSLSFTVLKALGVYNQIQPMLLNFLEPLGEVGAEIANTIVRFIQNMNVGVLGVLGLGLLLYTAVSLMQKIEDSLNFIWHVPRVRPPGERFSRYLTVLMIGPILVFSALGITASVMARGGRCEIKTSRRSAWGDSCLWPGEWPPAATRRATGSGWGANRETYLQIVTYAGPTSAIDCGTRRQPYFPEGPLDFLSLRAPQALPQYPSPARQVLFRAQR
ncbi:MAG: YihY/virulence factor BrkB family protein [Sulfuritalea sp.]|nr:YihY/virulence factor BrkB family protein [Sulfuritalea sp.]